MLVRRAKINDSKKIVRLHKQTILQENAGFYNHLQIKTWIKNITVENVRKEIKNDYFLVVIEDNRILGVSHFNKNGIIFEIYVKASFLGQGIGSMLLKESEKILFKLGMKGVILNSTLNAVSFYRNRGFKRIKEILFGKNKIKMIVMEKNLNGADY